MDTTAVPRITIAPLGLPHVVAPFSPENPLKSPKHWDWKRLFFTKFIWISKGKWE